MHQLSNVRELISAAYGSFAGILLIWSLQSSIALGVAWVAAKIDPSGSAATRYRIWMIALTACVALVPVSLFFRSLPATPGQTMAQPLIGFAAPFGRGPVTPVTQPTSLIWLGVRIVVPALWIAGVLLSLGRLTQSLWRLYKIRSGAEPVLLSEPGCPDMEADIGRLAHRPIMFSAQVRSPGLAGVFRPVILLPADIMSWTTSAERAAMLRHESAHIERRDHLTGLMVSVTRGLLFFHPMVHLAANRIGLERELACDERVMVGTDARVYADSILKAVGRSVMPDAVHHAPSFASKKTLERRMCEILTANHRPRPSRQWRFLAVPLAIILAVIWGIMPPASGPAAALAHGGRAVTGASGGPAVPAHVSRPDANSTGARQNVPVVDSNSIWVDTVTRGTLRIQIAGLGNVISITPGHSSVRLVMPEWGRGLLK
ncbi:MAG TPA: M56 family metallopeptidase, partial [Blastocatellia bacterium]